MSIANIFLTILMIGSIPIYSPLILAKIVEILNVGIMGELIWGFFIQFIINWIINFGSEYYYYVSNCKGTRTANTSTLVMLALIPAVIALGISVTLNFIPILKAPLLIFAVFGGMWVVDALVLILGNYGPWSLAINAASRMALLKNSCKK